MRIGIDAGGTFTDFVVLHGDGRMESFKLPSNPRAPHAVILAGIARAAGAASAEVVHGSTVATNALLERKGARTALVTTAGFEDLLEIGRQNRAQLYNLCPGPKRLLIPPELCFGVNERTHAGGEVAARPAAGELRRLKRRLRAAGVESVAICFLHSFTAPENERAAAAALAGAWYLCASEEICPEFREYERAATTALNAYVGPLMRRYLERLEGTRHRISILQSNGGSMTLGEAARQAVRTVLSGPAGGVAGAVAVARRSGFRRLIGFDMGGTSTDVSLADGAARETVEAVVDGLPVRVPMLEIHTVGAGGGSIARADAGGLLRVGPESAGADPGPACYGKGEAATVTDAHVVLGRIGAHQFLGGTMELDEARAEAAVARLGGELGLSPAETAAGILRVANASMDRAIRVVSVERGFDPRDFALVAFGGCGGLHACELAEQLGIRTVLAPRLAGALSALGMLLADRVRDYAAGVLGRTDLEGAFAALERRAAADLPGAACRRFADLRYRGQSYELAVEWQPGQTEERFHALHERTYGYRNPGRPVEVVAVRVRATLAAPKPALRAEIDAAPGRRTARRVFTAGRWRRIPTLERAQIPSKPIAGPALVLDYGSTTLIPPGWNFRLDRAGTLAATFRRAPRLA
jgi:N-methylhydantoinase A